MHPKLAGVLFALAGALLAQAPAPRPVAISLKLRMPKLDGANLKPALAKALQAEGLAVAFEGTAPAQIELQLRGHWNPEVQATELRVEGSCPAAPKRSAQSAVISRQSSPDLDLVVRAIQGVVQELLSANPTPKGPGLADPPVARVPPKGGSTPIAGNRIKAKGAIPPLEHPWPAKIKRSAGLATGELVIDAKGQVLEASLSSAPEELEQSALRYFRSLQFEVPDEAKGQAPLRFTAAVRYGLPSWVATSRISLEVVTGKEADPAIQPDPVRIREMARQFLSEEGIEVLEAEAAATPDSRHLRLEIETLKFADGLCLLGLQGFLSLHRPQAGQAPYSVKGHYESLFAGQRGLAGFKENLAFSVQELLRTLTLPPKPLPDPISKPWTTFTEGAEPMAFEQMKVKLQPLPTAYPPFAKLNRIQGTVKLLCVISEQGTPQQVTVLSGPMELAMTAVRYALTWQFEPTLVEGKPVRSRFLLTMPFRLR